MLEKLQEIIRNCLEDDQIIIAGDSALLNLGLNSFEFFDLISTVEETFNVNIPDRSISKLKTVQDIMDYISADE